MDTGALWRNRWKNPVYVYTAPWRRDRFLRVAFVLSFAMPLLLAVLLWLYGYPMPYLIPGFLLVALLLVPAWFLLFAVRYTPEQLEELYLTRLGREDVVFGSIAWAVIGGWAFSLVLALVFILVLTSQGALVHTSIACGFFLAELLQNLVLKTLRLWLTFPRQRFMVVICSPFTLVFDLVFLLPILVCAGFTSNPLSTLVSVPVFVALIAWNWSLAMRWAVQLYYREIDHETTPARLFLTMPWSPKQTPHTTQYPRPSGGTGDHGQTPTDTEGG